MFMLIIGLLAGCGETPAKINFAGEPVTTVHTTDAVPVNAATVMTAEGTALSTQPALVWSVTPDTVAKLDGDKVVPVADGDAKVKACAGEICAEYDFKVAMPNDIAVTGADGVEWKAGATAQLTAKVLAGETEIPGQKVTWTSDNAAVATVDESGKVTVVAPGAATITATAGTLSEATAITIVDPAAVPATPPTN